MAASLICWNCGESLADIPLPISRHANCASCFEVLHCCRMCRYYSPKKRPYCDEERADPPVVKDNANFCDYFEPTNRVDARDAGQSKKSKSELDSLFGDSNKEEMSGSAPADDEDEALDKFNDLFDD